MVEVNLTLIPADEKDVDVLRNVNDYGIKSIILLRLKTIIAINS